MKINTVLIFLFFAFGMNDGNAQTIDFLDYNSSINRAELAIINRKYTKALRYYDKAFSKKTEFIDPRDLNNAIVAAINTKDAQTAFIYAKALAAYGIGAAFFEKQRKFDWLKQQKGWANLIEVARNIKKQISPEHRALRSKLTEMRSKFDAAMETVKKGGGADWSSFSEVESGLSKQLYNILTKNGYLSYKSIGVTLKDDTVIQEPIFTPIVKWCGILPDGEMAYNPKFDSIFLTAMKRGAIKSSYFQSTILSNLTEKIALPEATLIDCVLYLKDLKEDEIQHTDSIRSAYGLCSYQEYIQKLRYNANNKNAPFYILPEIPNYYKTKSWIQLNSPNFFSQNKVIDTVKYCN